VRTCHRHVSSTRSVESKQRKPLQWLCRVKRKRALLGSNLPRDNLVGLIETMQVGAEFTFRALLRNHISDR